MTWTNNFSKTFLIFASLIPFFRLIIPEKCFYQWILCHNFVYMKKFPWFLSFELGARQACDRRHRTMGTVHSGKISHLTWTFTKKYWAVLGCTGLYWAVLGHLRYLLGNVQVKWRILPLCSGPAPHTQYLMTAHLLLSCILVTDLEGLKMFIIGNYRCGTCK